MAALDVERTAKPTFGEKRAERGTEKDVAGAYDSGFSGEAYGARTSLIIDPPDGRIPPTLRRCRSGAAAIGSWVTSLQARRRAEEGAKAATAASTRGRRARGSRAFALLLHRAHESLGRSGGREADGALHVGHCRTSGPPSAGSSDRAVAGRRVDVLRHGPRARVAPRHPVDGSPHLPPSIRLWWGDSRGHWEGNTLVVDVTNFTPKGFPGIPREPAPDRALDPLGPTTIEYSVTIDDPTTWTKPWTVKQELKRQSPGKPDLQRAAVPRGEFGDDRHARRRARAGARVRGGTRPRSGDARRRRRRAGGRRREPGSAATAERGNRGRRGRDEDETATTPVGDGGGDDRTLSRWRCCTIAGQTPATPGQAPEGRPGAEDAVGRTRPAGDLDRRVRHAAAAPAAVRQQGILHRRGARRSWTRSAPSCSAATSASSAAPSSTSPAPTTPCSCRSSGPGGARR